MIQCGHAVAKGAMLWCRNVAGRSSLALRILFGSSSGQGTSACYALSFILLINGRANTPGGVCILAFPFLSKLLKLRNVDCFQVEIRADQFIHHLPVLSPYAVAVGDETMTEKP